MLEGLIDGMSILVQAGLVAFCSQMAKTSNFVYVGCDKQQNWCSTDTLQSRKEHKRVYTESFMLVVDGWLLPAQA